MTDCAQHGDHHQYRPGKRQIRAADGSSYHPTVRDSWVRGLFCPCGTERPPDEEPKVRAALAATARLRRLSFGQEPGYQAPLPL